MLSVVSQHAPFHSRLARLLRKDIQSKTASRQAEEELCLEAGDQIGIQPCALPKLIPLSLFCEVSFSTWFNTYKVKLTCLALFYLCHEGS